MNPAWNREGHGKVRNDLSTVRILPPQLPVSRIGVVVKADADR